MRSSDIYFCPSLRRRSVRCLIFIVLVCGLRTVDGASLANRSEETLRILTIGNSFADNATRYLSELAESISIKLEGSRKLGNRIVSILPLRHFEGVDPELHVYGRNGVESAEADFPIRELGIVVAVKSDNKQHAKDTLAFIRSTLLHFGYEGRISTAGNLAFPFSPSDFLFKNADQSFSALFIAGTRDPIFQEQFEVIKTSVIEALKSQHADLIGNTEIEFIAGDKNSPIAVLETVSNSIKEAQIIHSIEESDLLRWIDPNRQAFRRIDAGDVFTWSVHHLIQDLSVIEELFPIQISSYSAGRWSETSTIRTRYEDVSCADKEEFHDEKTSSLKEPDTPVGTGSTSVALQSLAHVIRSKNSGINEITFDIMFKSEDGYQQIIQYGLFSPNSIAAIMNLDPSDVLGSYRYDPALAIKFTLQRKSLCGSPGERDTFGAQQHTRLLNLDCPIKDLNEPSPPSMA
jgi:hypothetical protein